MRIINAHAHLLRVYKLLQPLPIPAVLTVLQEFAFEFTALFFGGGVILQLLPPLILRQIIMVRVVAPGVFGALR